MEVSRLTRDGAAEPVSRDQILRHARGQGNIIFPVQLTTSRIGNLTRLIHTLLYVMTIHTYIQTYEYAEQSCCWVFGYDLGYASVPWRVFMASAGLLLRLTTRDHQPRLSHPSNEERCDFSGITFRTVFCFVLFCVDSLRKAAKIVICHEKSYRH